jgi:hypothetical protein
MSNDNRRCTCRGTALGACHVEPARTTTADIMRTVARQSRPAHHGADAGHAARSAQAADRHRQNRQHDS